MQSTISAQLASYRANVLCKRIHIQISELTFNDDISQKHLSKNKNGVYLIFSGTLLPKYFNVNIYIYKSLKKKSKLIRIHHDF